MIKGSRLIPLLVLTLAVSSFAKAVPGNGSTSAGDDEYAVVSASLSGDLGNEDSTFLGMSDDGRYVLFASSATNLAPNPTALSQIFRKDNSNGVVTIASSGSNGSPGNGSSNRGVMSGNGRWVAFITNSSDLGNTDGSHRLFLKDMLSGQVTFISSDYSGSLFDFSIDLSNDAEYLLYKNVVYSRNSDIHTILDWPYYLYSEACISNNGRFILFASAEDSVVSNDTNGTSDVFLWDRLQDITTRESLSHVGAQLNDSSAMPSESCGLIRSEDQPTIVTFESKASNAVEGTLGKKDRAFIRTRVNNELTNACVEDAVADTYPCFLVVSHSGAFAVAYRSPPSYSDLRFFSLPSTNATEIPRDIVQAYPKFYGLAVDTGRPLIALMSSDPLVPADTSPGFLDVYLFSPMADPPTPTPSSTLTPARAVPADANCDGQIDIQDSLAVRRILAGLQETCLFLVPVPSAPQTPMPLRE